VNDSGELAPYRLPRTATPVRYDLEFAPNLEAATFSGSARVEVLVTEPTTEIVMNAADLDITDATIGSGWESAGDVVESTPAQIELEPEEKRVHFVAPALLEPGRYTVSSRFSAVLNDLLLGFYRSRFVDDNGTEHTIATTHFEETDARRAFPCFDEPDLKAVFGITLIVPKEMFAVSNARELSSEDLEDGTRKVRFADTIKMSTYLVAFVVGPFVATDPMDVLGTAVRVIHRPGKENLTQMALDFSEHALRFYTDYFDIPYPGDKLDLVGLPDFAQGAMENIGCVTFREADLLADPEHSSLTEIARIAEVAEHEIAHMWFGDLVTMKWWNGVWLNEAFATFMSFLCQEDKSPENEPFLFAVSHYWPVAFENDATSSTRPIEFPVGRPEEATAMFDPLTYYKGGGVLWMIERYLGGDHFRDGIRRYLKAHAYGNAETTDLWDAIEEANPDVPVRSLMDSWIFQGGYPLVNASWHDGTIELSQQPFSFLPADELASRPSAIGSTWLIPIRACTPSQPEATTRILLDKAPESFAAPELPVVVNCGGSGFYRVRYDETLRSALLNNIELLQPIERYYLVSDVWATTRAGLTSVAEFFRTIDALENEANPYVWMIAISALRTIDLVVPNDLRGAYAAYLRRTLRPKLDRIGWQAQPGEKEQTAYLRGLLIGTLGTIGSDDEVVSFAYARFLADRTPGHEIDADSASAVLSVVAAHASRPIYETILDRFRHPTSPLDEDRYEFSLTQVTDLSLAREIFELARNELRNQDAPFIFAGMMRRRELAAVTWRYVAENFDELDAKFPPSLVVRMFEGIPSLVEVDAEGHSVYLEEVRAFVDAKISSARRRFLEQQIEELEVKLRFATAVRSELGAILSER
jgi:puromycin-sensitive aminopeptidase